MREEHKKQGLATCSESCAICYRDAPDPEPAPEPGLLTGSGASDFDRGYRLGKEVGFSRAKEVEVSFAEIQRLTLENSLLRGELATLRAHAKLSREG